MNTNKINPEPIVITLQQIKDNDPCPEGWDLVLAANGGPEADYNKEFLVSSILESNSLNDTLWVLRCLPEHDLLWRKYAWFCASEVKHLSDDPRVEECLDVVNRYCAGEASDEELWAARDAAWDAAWAAAGAAAGDAAWYAARSAVTENQTNKLRQILDAGEWV